MRGVHEVRDFGLEDGTVLAHVRQAYTLLGELNEERDNLVLLFHSLTGTPDPRDWWPDLTGPGAVIDTRNFAVLAPNLLGSCYGTSPPPQGAAVTTRDMARLVAELVRDLEVRSVALVAGGSLGGMVTLEWVATFPTATRAAVAFAAPAAQTAHSLGLNHVQRRALDVASQAGRPEAGLELARMMAMLSYRTQHGLETRFARDRRPDGEFQVRSWLDHHGTRLLQRFDGEAYRTLLSAMDSHDVGRARASASAALRAFPGCLVAAGIAGDQLYEAAVVKGWAQEAGARYREIRSVHGHDAFLLEPVQVGAILGEALAAAGAAASAAASAGSTTGVAPFTLEAAS
ncbi:MAG TPA: alpha/beta fold hydrolase [Longimicrobiales bacterium]|nr:alpha/beta fold hydrolase [Longimicrobiales bacterium]